MAKSLGETLMHAWNSFTGNRGSYPKARQEMGMSYGARPDRPRLHIGNERSIITSIYTRLGIDVAAVEMRHVKVDKHRRYEEDKNSKLDYLLNVEANKDQTGRQLRQDIAMTMFDKGVAVVMPVKTDKDPELFTGFEIESARVGEVLNWWPDNVTIRVYNDTTGNKEDIVMAKQAVAIIENPLYAIMNEPNSTLQRLIRKLNMLDAIDEQSASGKLDLIIQLPYVIRSDSKQEQANKRKKDIEMQLKDSQHGIAYTDATEKITQLNRPVENNLMGQIEYLTAQLYAQLGLTEDVFTGKADAQTMLNYYNRTIEPVLGAVADEINRKFISKTARTQGQAIRYFRDPFKYASVEEIAHMADLFTRNEIFSPNDIRAILGWRPSSDKKADELRNRNIPESKQEGTSQNGREIQPPA